MRYVTIAVILSGLISYVDISGVPITDADHHYAVGTPAQPIDPDDHEDEHRVRPMRIRTMRWL